MRTYNHRQHYTIIRSIHTIIHAYNRLLQARIAALSQLPPAGEGPPAPRASCDGHVGGLQDVPTRLREVFFFEKARPLKRLAGRHLVEQLVVSIGTPNNTVTDVRHCVQWGPM